MAVKAVLQKQCPASGTVYIVPGFLAVRTGSDLITTTGRDEIIVDIMPTNVARAKFENPTAKLRLIEPAGCEFQLPTQNLPPASQRKWTFPVAGDKTWVECVIFGVREINRDTGNSLSYRFPITGRAGRECKVEVLMTAEPINVVTDSCVWTVSKLNTDTTNIGNKPLDIVVSG
ncbi:hypothetical protein [Nocardia bhagyanarayanae]|uniref:Uncharacterized protein n=1 Tax=Nocardia bhagyanarayanae TaxID=1215925 RepID=A0A543EXZ1_9NOCA|nr:hypothetical protein [Nocardia bhagyanarayanae]TQM26457.1 hypothetical protein FB390_6654 [Nocardia bhagyanarayanae]